MVGKSVQRLRLTRRQAGSLIRTILRKSSNSKYFLTRIRNTEKLIYKHERINPMRRNKIVPPNLFGLKLNPQSQIPRHTMAFQQCEQRATHCFDTDEQFRDLINWLNLINSDYKRELCQETESSVHVSLCCQMYISIQCSSVFDMLLLVGRT